MSQLSTAELNDLVHIFPTIHAEGVAAAKQAVADFRAKHGQDAHFGCGFAWVNIYRVRANSKFGKALAAEGFRKDSYSKAFRLSNPSNDHTQCSTTKYEGAQAYAKVLEGYGITAYAGERLD